MDVDLIGFKANCGDECMGDLLIHKGHRMTESETRKAVNWGIENGYNLASELPDEVVDKICDPQCDDYEKYDDTPHVFTVERLRNVLCEIAGYCDRLEMPVDELIEKIKEKI